MFKEGSLDSRTSVLIGGVLATSVFFANPNLYKISTVFPNFQFSTTAAHESTVTVQLGPSMLEISVPVVPAQSQIASVAAAASPVDESIATDVASAAITMASPQVIEKAFIEAPVQSAPSIGPVSESVAAPAITEITPAFAAPAPVIAVPTPTIESVQVQAPAQESVAPSVPVEAVTGNTAVESPSAPAASDTVAAPIVESVVETEVPVSEAPVEASEPPAEVPAAIPAVPTPECHPSYSGCLKIDAEDYDCEGGTGNGPYYTGKVQVIGPDVFGLDKNGDGWGCEAS